MGRRSSLGIGGWDSEPILVSRVTHPKPLPGGDGPEIGAGRLGPILGGNRGGFLSVAVLSSAASFLFADKVSSFDRAYDYDFQLVFHP